MQLRVLTWNLMQGRSVPGAGRDLFDEFATALDGWRWDVALLQEVRPWWPPGLATRLGCEQRTVLASRNALLPLRRAIADRAPDLIKANGGIANAILARVDRIADHRTERLCVWPERRWVHGIRLGWGPWIANLHCSTGGGERSRRDGRVAAATARGWADGTGDPLVLGGDFNWGKPELDGLTAIASSDVDHVLVAGLEAAGASEVLDRGTLSDHAPVAVDVVVG